MKNKICVYAICKNEKKFVANWMASMKEADVIVILDTGSTDGTYEALVEKKEEFNKKHSDETGKRYPFVIVEQCKIDPWRFDVARNASMKYIPDDCNILFCTDLDELVEPGWGDILREKWVEGKHKRCCYKYTWSHLSNGKEGRAFRYDKIHSRDWIWKYPVHELLWNTTTDSNKFTYDDQLDLFDQIHLHHYPDKSKSRSSYLPLLEMRKEEDPNDHYGLIYLAHEYFYRGRYEDSIQQLNDILRVHKDKCSTIEIASCHLFMGDDYRALKQYAMAQLCYMRAIDIEPTYREPQLALAALLIKQKAYQGALVVLNQCMETTFRHYTWLERDVSWSYEIYDLLSLASFYSGKKRDSLAYAYKAYSFEPENERLKNNLSLILDHMTDKELLQN